MPGQEKLDALLLLILLGMAAFFTLQMVSGGTSGQFAAGGGKVVLPPPLAEPPAPVDAPDQEPGISESPGDTAFSPDPLAAIETLFGELRGSGLGLPFPVSDRLSALPANSSFPGATDPTAVSDTPSGKRAEPALSEAELFSKLWPESYLRHLSSLERMVIRDGLLVEFDPAFSRPMEEEPEQSGPAIREWFIPPEKRHAAFRSDADVYAALLNIIEERFEAGLTTREGLLKSRFAITVVLPKIIQQDREQLRRGLPRADFPRPSGYVASCSYEPRSLTGFLTQLAAEFTFLKPALAGWYTSPDCYKDDDPNKKELGFNTSANQCNDGLRCTKKGCVYIYDCGPNGQLCNVQLGCLNGACASWPNAIWDPGGTCGCG